MDTTTEAHNTHLSYFLNKDQFPSLTLNDAFLSILSEAIYALVQQRSTRDSELSKTIWWRRSNDQIFKWGRGLGTKSWKILRIRWWREQLQWRRRWIEADENDVDDDDDDDHEDDDEVDDKDEGDDEEETDDGDTESDTENEEVDPWDKLREEVISDLVSAWEEQVQENLHNGLPKDDAQVEGSKRLLPVYRRKLRELYLHDLRWSRLENWSSAQEGYENITYFMEDDGMDYMEDIEAAISKRKYLLNSLFDLEHFLKDTLSTEDDHFPYEARKRKYCESWYT